MGRVNPNLYTCVRVGDPKVGITSQGYPTRAFSVYSNGNLNLPNGTRTG